MADETATTEVAETTEAPAQEQSAAEAPAKGSERAPDGKFAKKADAPIEQADWRKGAPDDDLRKEADKYNSPWDAVRSAREGQQRISRSILKPGKDATPEEKAAYQATLRREMGIPDKVEDYKVDIPTALAEDEQTMEGIQALLGKFHELGVPASAASYAISLHQQLMETQHKSLVAETANAMADSEVELRREWGADYEPNDAISRAALARYADDDLINLTKLTGKELGEALGNKRLGDVAALKRLFAKVGRDTGESRTIFQKTQEGAGMAEEIKRLRATEEYKRGDKAMQNRVNELYQRLYGDEPAAA